VRDPLVERGSARLAQLGARRAEAAATLRDLLGRFAARRELWP
jgi:hypothetical protein